ncbi:MAG: carboxy terminal-processing peptidase [Kiritimatiellae bacterium]|nr:carboxy terminal-processing peptidase [Kiritimatiellia bacterium]
MKLLVSALLLSVALSTSFAKNLQPNAEYPEISRRVVYQLNTTHLSGERFDDRLSAIAWTNLVDALDYDHTLLTKEELAKFESYKTQIDDLVSKGNLAFGYELVSLVRDRILERCALAEKTLKQEKPFDFTKDEQYQWKRRKAERPANRKEQEALWHATLKNEYLALTLAKEFDAEEAKTKAKEDKEEDKPDYSEEDDLSQPVAEIIAKRYRALRDTYKEMDSEIALQRILSAVAMSYDPHTDYMSPMNFEEFSMDMNLTLCGIGATLRYDDGMIRITEIMPGAPAANDTREIRLQEGDRIIGVGQGDGPIEDICHKPLNQTIRKIRGPKGSVVTLKVIPVSDKTGTRTKIVDLVRDEIHLDQQAVTGHIERLTLDDGSARKMGYVRIPAFYAGTVSGTKAEQATSMTRDLLAYIQNFNTEHVDGLVIDLRNNGGGSLMEALSMTSLFVTGPVVQVRDKRNVQVLDGTLHRVAFRKPIVVLINRNSASASEIVASALQDYGRAIIIGDSKSHGKGTVQTVQALGNNKVHGANRITTACFYRINGGTTQLKGVEPDLVIPSIYDALELGEDQLPGALPYSTVAPAFYAKTSDVAPFLPRLKKASDKRMKKDAQAQAALQLIEHVRKANAEEYVPLQVDARRARMKAERAIEKLQDEAMKGSKKNKGPTAENDYVLREALAILSDYIDLRGGPDEPVNVNGDLRSRIFDIFGEL